MKSVLISIQPYWCEKILNGKKTIEIRKTRPKLETPFKCYIYCTKATQKVHHSEHLYGFQDELYRVPDGKIKYGDSIELMCYGKIDGTNFLNGKVVAEFVCDKVETFWNVATDKWELLMGNVHEQEKKELLENALLSEEQVHEYAKGKKCLYGWHISNLKIYDKPKFLWQFTMFDKKDCYYEHLPLARPSSCAPCPYCKLTRPPQSWMYVEDLKGE